MVLTKVKLAQIPPIIEDFAKQVMDSNNRLEARDNYSQKLEYVMEYCHDVLEAYAKIRQRKRK